MEIQESKGRKDTKRQKQLPKKNYLLFFVCVTLIAYIARISELFPLLGKLRINLLLFAATLFFFFGSKSAKKFSFQKNSELKLIILWFLVGVLGIPFSVWPGHAFSVCTGTLFINVLVFIFAQSVIQSEKDFFKIVGVILISNLLLLYGMFFKPNIVEGYRVSTTYSYDPNDIAMLFTFSAAIIISFFIRAKIWAKLFFLTVLILLVLAIIKTGSRGGILAFAIVGAGIFISHPLRLKTVHKVLVVAMIVGLVLSPSGEVLRDRFYKVISGEDYNMTNTDSDAGGRLAIWHSGFTIFLEHPILGVGAGSSSVAMGDKFGGTSWMTMHNSFLQIAVEMGILGLLLYLAMLYKIWCNCQAYLKKYKKKKDYDKITSFTAALKISLVSYLAAAFFLSQAFSVIVPLSLALSSRLPEPEEEAETLSQEPKKQKRRKSKYIPPSQRTQPPS